MRVCRLEGDVPSLGTLGRCASKWTCSPLFSQGLNQNQRKCWHHCWWTNWVIWSLFGRQSDETQPGLSTVSWVVFGTVSSWLWPQIVGPESPSSTLYPRPVCLYFPSLIRCLVKEQTLHLLLLPECWMSVNKCTEIFSRSSEYTVTNIAMRRCNQSCEIWELLTPGMSKNMFSYM